MRLTNTSSILAAAAIAMTLSIPVIATTRASSFDEVEHVVGEEGGEAAERTLVP